MRDWKRMGMVAALAALLTMVAPAALATAPGASGVVERGPGNGGFFYWGNGHLAITGLSIEDVCMDIAPEVTGTWISPANGSSQQHLRGRVPVMVFEDARFDTSDPNIGFMWLDETCSAVLDDDETTNAPEPVAVGEVRLHADFRVDTDAVTHSHNSLVGRVTTTSGEVAHLNTFAQLSYDDFGLIGINQLRFHYTG